MPIRGKKTRIIAVSVCCSIAATALGVVYYRSSREAALAEADKCGSALPEWLTLDKKIAFSARTIDRMGNRNLQPVREKLADIGAKCMGGEIFCRQGKKVVFYRVPERGTTTREMEKTDREEADRIRQLELDHTVIRIYRDVGRPR